MSEQFLGQFWPALWSTVAGGVLLTLIFFFLREFIFSMPTLAGLWECEFVVLDSTYNPYKGMKITHEVVLLQNGAQLTGSGEKDREHSSLNGEMSYSGKGRTQVKVAGVIEKRFLRHDRIQIYWDDDGRMRKSAAFFELKTSGCKHQGDLSGTAYTAAGKCRGHVTWRRVIQ
jgi:hypothetical protein